MPDPTKKVIAVKTNSATTPVPNHKVVRGGKTFDKTYLPESTPFKLRPCVGDGCGKQVTKDSSRLLGYYDDSAAFDPKIFGNSDHSAYGQWNAPTTYANKKDADGNLRTRKLQMTESQMMDPKMQKDSLSQGDKIYFRKPGIWNQHAGASNKAYGRGKTDQEVRHVAMVSGRNKNGEPLLQHSMGYNDLNNETMADLQARGYTPKLGYRTKATHQKLQDNPALGYGKKTTLKANSNDDYVNKAKKVIDETKDEIGQKNGLSRTLMDRLAGNVIPIHVQESNAGFKKSADGKSVEKASGLSNFIDDVYDSKFANKVIKPIAKAYKNMAQNELSFGKHILSGDFVKAFQGDGKKQSPWQMELEANKLTKGHPEKLKETYAELKKANDRRYVDVFGGASSRGYGKVKEIPSVAKEFGVTEANLEGFKDKHKDDKIKNGAIASQAVLAENAKRIKQKFPSLSEEQIADLATTGYNSGLDSVMKKEYIENYIVNKRKGSDGKVLTSDYLEKIKNLRGPVVNHRTPLKK